MRTGYNVEKYDGLVPSDQINIPYYNIVENENETPKYIVNVWINTEVVFKEVYIGANDEKELKKITDKYDKGIVDFFNIYLGINSVKNYIDDFAPKPEFLLTNEKIKSKEDLYKVIKKYKRYWRGNDEYKKFCINILEDLYYNNRIIYIKAPVENIGIKFIQTKGAFNEFLKQDNNRLWGYFIRATKKAKSTFY